jgi:hypothetical protein
LEAKGRKRRKSSYRKKEDGILVYKEEKLDSLNLVASTALFFVDSG